MARYTTLTLPTELVEELKIWRMAFNASYGKEVTYGEMIRGMLDSLEETDPGVVEALEHIVAKNPELMKQLVSSKVGLDAPFFKI